MAITSEPHLFAVLGSQRPDFPDILGSVETVWLEFKKELSDLTKQPAKLEMAKDVSSLANAEGGVLVIGVQTQRDTKTSDDIAVAICPLSNGLINCDQLRQILMRYVYPGVSGLECNIWDANDDDGLITVRVPRQDEWRKPFVVTEGLGEDGTIRTNMIGIYIRDGGIVVPMSAHYIQETLRLGEQLRRAGFSGDSASISQLLSLMPPGLVAPSATQDVLGDLGDQLARDLDAADLTEDSYLFVQEWRPAGFRIHDLHSRTPEGMRAMFENPSQLRRNGFNIDFRGELQVTEGGGLRRVRPGVAVLSLTPAGLLTAVTGSYFLGWGMEQNYPHSINPLALVEIVAETCRFAFEPIASRDSRTRTTNLRAGLRNLDPSRLWFLLDEVPNDRIFWGERHPPGANARQIDSGEMSSDDAETAAFELLSRIYSQFGLGPEDIPFSDPDSSRVSFNRLARA